jgi:hypothetical protein
MKKQAFLMMLGMAVLAGCAHDKTAAPPPGAQARSYYTKPLTTPGSRYTSLPSNVQTTVLAEVGAAEIANVVQEMNAGRLCFKIYFMDPATYPPLFVGSDGSVLNPDMTVAVPAPRDEAVVKFDDLPLSVTKVVQAGNVGRPPDLHRFLQKGHSLSDALRGVGRNDAAAGAIRPPRGGTCAFQFRFRGRTHLSFCTRWGDAPTGLWGIPSNRVPGPPGRAITSRFQRFPMAACKAAM